MNKIIKKLQSRCEEAEKTKEVRAELFGNETQLIENLEKEIETNPKVLSKKKGQPSRSIIEKGVQAIDSEATQFSLFNSFPIPEITALPTLLSRLPIFIPYPAKEQKALLDTDNALVFETPFGKGRRLGPNLTMNDENTLLALIRLKQRKLEGIGSKLPIPQNRSTEVGVHACITTVSQIINELELSDGGDNFNIVVKSLKRIDGTVLQIETKKHDLYFGEHDDGESFKLVDIKWSIFENDGFIYAQISPLVSQWLEEQQTYLNWEIRKRLHRNPNGQALYRFLSTQNSGYEMPITYIADVIYWHGKRNRLKPKMEKIMEILRDEFHWCDFKFSGTGRKIPYKLKLIKK